MTHGLGRGRTAVDIELTAVAAVGAQMRREQTAILARAGLVDRLHDHRARAVAEQDAGGAVGPVEDAREGLRPDHQRALEIAALQVLVGGRDREHEAGTDRLQVEGRTPSDAELGLNRDRGRWKRLVRRRGGEHDEIDGSGRQVRLFQRRARRGDPEIRSDFAFGRDVALLDAGALHDPLVVGFDEFRKLFVGQYAGGKIAADATHHRTLHAHDTALPARRCSPAACRAMPAAIRCCNSLRTTS